MARNRTLITTLLLAAALLELSAPAQAVLIDDFNGGYGEVTGNDIAVQEYFNAWGGQRTLQIDGSSDDRLSVELETVNGINGILWHENGDSSPNDSLVRWGGGGAPDLTDGGSSDRFAIEFLTVGPDDQFNLRVQDTDVADSFDFTVDGPGIKTILFSELSVNFAEITQIELNITGTSPLSSIQIDSIETVGATAVPVQEDVVVDLGSIALWAWMNDAGWLKLNNSSPDRITTGDMDGNGDDDVIADFTSTLGGIFVKYNLGGWTQLANPASEQMTSGDLDNNGQDDVVIDFGAANGLWARMNNTSWLKLNNASPEQVVVADMDNNGADDVIGDFGVSGIFVKRNLGAWVKLHNSNPEAMTAGDLDNGSGDDLVVDFGASLALWARMNDSSWLKLHNSSPDVIASGDIDGNGADDVLAGFATTVGGFWAKLNLGGWTQQNPNSPDDVVTADVTGNGEDDIVADFGSTVGGLFIKRDQGAWVKQHNTSPDSMAPGELD